MFSFAWIVEGHLYELKNLLLRLDSYLHAKIKRNTSLKDRCFIYSDGIINKI